jgi:phage tail-like protein
MKPRTLLACGLLVVAVAAAALVSSSQVTAAQRTDDQVTAARFAITIDGQTIASFSELSGLTSGIDSTEFFLTGDKQTVLHLPDRRVPPTITLKRGMTDNLDLWQWHEAALSDPDARKDAQFVIYGADGDPVARWVMQNAWPSKMEIGALKAGSSEVLVETITLVSQQMRRVK